MRTSILYAPTRRNCTSAVEGDSYALLTRAGFIHKQAAGIYTYLPLMNKVLAKVEQIIREEMTKQGAQELRMPILQRKDIWEQSGRWQEYIDSGTMFRLTDRRDNEFALGPTHEEVISDVVRDALRSHRQMPVNLFQIGPKFRDEFRPRSGLLRCREFIMKDAYSFDKDEQGLNESYRRMILAYKRIFGRCRLDFVMVEADSGPIGGNSSHEFMAITNCGEDVVLICNACGYAANLEKAVSKPPSTKNAAAPDFLCNVATIDARDDEKVKILTFRAGRDESVVALIRGDAQVNKIKLKNAIGSADLPLTSDEEVYELTGVGSSPSGFMNFKPLTRVIFDESVRGLASSLCGANGNGYRTLNLDYGGDSHAPEFADIRYAEAGDSCAWCDSGRLLSKRAVELGHVFKLGTKYSEPMGLTFLDESGKERPVVMGCYGIGVSRIVAAVVEQNHDEKGIIWPANVAPFTTVVIPTSPSHRRRAEQVYDEMIEARMDVILDDRDVSFGVKIKDADLIGYPYKAIIGNHANDGRIEVEDRRRGEGQLLHMKEFPCYVNILNF